MWEPATWYCPSTLWSIDICQNRIFADQHFMTVSRAQVKTHRGYVFFEVYCWQVSNSQLIAGPTLIGFLYCTFFSLTLSFAFSLGLIYISVWYPRCNCRFIENCHNFHSIKCQFSCVCVCVVFFLLFAFIQNKCRFAGKSEKNLKAFKFRLSF